MFSNLWRCPLVSVNKDYSYPLWVYYVTLWGVIIYCKVFPWLHPPSPHPTHVLELSPGSSAYEARYPSLNCALVLQVHFSQDWAYPLDLDAPLAPVQGSQDGVFSESPIPTDSHQFSPVCGREANLFHFCFLCQFSLKVEMGQGGWGFQCSFYP